MSFNAEERFGTKRTNASHNDIDMQRIQYSKRDVLPFCLPTMCLSTTLARGMDDFFARDSCVTTMFQDISLKLKPVELKQLDALDSWMAPHF